MKRRLTNSFPFLLSLLLMISISSLAQKNKPGPPPPPPPPADPAIAYVAERAWSTTDLMVMNADGSNKKVLMAGGNGPTSNGYHDPSWSPDSNKIAFCFNHDLPSSEAIYLINKDGSGLCKVVDMAHSCPIAGRPQWSPDGSKILYADSDGVSGNDLFLIDAICNADPSNKLNLTQTPNTEEFHPTWSPDGSRVAVVVYINSLPNIVLYDVNADRTHATPGPIVGAGFRAPKWAQLSLDSNMLAASNGDVGIIDLNKLEFNNLTGTLNISESWPAWSPLDDTIIYARERGLWIVSTAGGVPKQIVAPPTKQVILNEPDWRRTP